MDKGEEKILSINIKDAIDAPLEINIDEQWNRFEERVYEKKRKRRARQQLLKVAVITLVVVVSSVSIMPDKVIGFKNNIYHWFTKTNEGVAVITDERNPVEVEEGTYKNLDYDSAQAMVSFEIKKIDIIFNFADDPVYDVIINVFPKATVTATYKEDDRLLILSQELLLPNEGASTYIPSNNQMDTIEVNDTEVLVIVNDNMTQAMWEKGSQKYLLISKNINEADVMAVVEALI